MPDTTTPCIARAVQTSYACPSQWDAQTTEGTDLYLRYRHGRGTVTEGGPWGTDIIVFEYTFPDGRDGLASLEEFCKLAGMDLADDLTYIEYGS